MKKIIMLTDFFYPKPLANGICIYRIGQALINLDYQVHVICFKRLGELDEEIIDNIYIHRVNPRFFYTLMEIADSEKINSSISNVIRLIALSAHRVKKVINFSFYPLVSFISVWRYYVLTRKTIEKFDINNLLAQYSPIEAVAAGNIISKNKNIRTILYVVDSFTNTPNANKYKLIKKAGWRWEKRLYNNFELIINMDFHKQHHSADIYNKYKHKMIFTGLPLVQEKTDNCKSYYSEQIDEKIINCIYAGALDTNIRNPTYLCKLFEAFSNNEVRLHFFTRGNCQEILDAYQKSTNNLIVNHEFVESDKIGEILCSADILISIGNTGTQMVPSKIFDYVSYGKPIIHIYKDENDSSLKYLNSYPLSLCIKEDDTLIEKQIQMIRNFIFEAGQHRVDFREIKDIYSDFTPEHSAEIIDKFLF
jgi:hypothetical protein